jgi:hypothetical protein
MLYSKMRMTVVGCGLAALVFLMPAQSEGGLFDCLCPWSSGCGASSATTCAPPYVTQRVALMPVVGAPATGCSSVGRSCYYAPTTGCSTVGRSCYYAPQTTSRWSYSRMSVTSYRPVTTVDPCTGCASTVVQPVTRKTLLPWLHRRPVTSYGLNCTTGCAPSCTTACYPSYTSAWSPSCSVGACSPLYQPTGIVGTIRTAPGSGCSTGCAPITTIPQAGASATSTTDPAYGTSTFKEKRAIEATDPTGQATPQPDPGIESGPSFNGNPASIQRRERSKWTDPENKTASRPLQYAAYRTLIEKPAATNVSFTPQLDVGGWRASRD